MRNIEASYERPLKAKLIVRLENGEEWEATAADLEKFDLDRPSAAYYRFDQALGKLLGAAGLIEREDVTRSRLNHVRYLAELTICHPDLVDLSEETWARIVEMERILQEHLPSDD